MPKDELREHRLEVARDAFRNPCFLFDMNDYIGYSGMLTKLWKSGNLDGIQVIGFRTSGCGWREATGIV